MVQLPSSAGEALGAAIAFAEPAVANCVRSEADGALSRAAHNTTATISTSATTAAIPAATRRIRTPRYAPPTTSAALKGWLRIKVPPAVGTQMPRLVVRVLSWQIE